MNLFILYKDGFANVNRSIDFAHIDGERGADFGVMRIKGARRGEEGDGGARGAGRAEGKGGFRGAGRTEGKGGFRGAGRAERKGGLSGRGKGVVRRGRLWYANDGD